MDRDGDRDRDRERDRDRSRDRDRDRDRDGTMGEGQGHRDRDRDRDRDGGMEDTGFMYLYASQRMRKYCDALLQVHGREVARRWSFRDKFHKNQINFILRVNFRFCIFR